MCTSIVQRYLQKELQNAGKFLKKSLKRLEYTLNKLISLKCKTDRSVKLFFSSWLSIELCRIFSHGGHNLFTLLSITNYSSPSLYQGLTSSNYIELLRTIPRYFSRWFPIQVRSVHVLLTCSRHASKPFNSSCSYETDD